MRLSDIRGERVLDVIADITAPVINIASDDEAARFFERKPPKEGQTPQEALAERMGEAAPALLRRHRDDLIAILATLDGVTVDEYVEGMTLGSVLVDVFELLTDEAFESFLSSQEQTEEEGQSGTR